MYAPSRGAAKCGGQALTLTFDDAASYLQRTAVNVAALSELDEQLRRIAEKRLFAGLTIKDTFEVPGISPATIERDWVKAGGWLFGAMTGEAPA